MVASNFRHSNFMIKNGKNNIPEKILTLGLSEVTIQEFPKHEEFFEEEGKAVHFEHHCELMVNTSKSCPSSIC
jgi:hypothetical protein